MSEQATKTEIVKASELYDKVVWRIFASRNEEKVRTYQAAIKTYKRRLGKRPEVTREEGFSAKKVGFYKEVFAGQKAFIERPQDPRPPAYGYFSYSRSGWTTHARSYGVLANPRFNRDIRPQRVDEYEAEMQAGRWHDLLSDPISITPEGDVLNGQHRLAAASLVDWSKVEQDPLFLVLWGVSPKEAMHADGSRRTAKDEKTIASRLLVAS
jgi:hypothetical protein